MAAPIPTRRFGRTGLAMPVLSLGGMRFQQSWSDLPAAEITAASQANLRAVLAAAGCGPEQVVRTTVFLTDLADFAAVNAIYAEEDLPADQVHMTKLNAELALLPTWKSITKRKIPMPDADDWKDKTGKLSELIR